MVQERRQFLLRLPRCSLPYPRLGSHFPGSASGACFRFADSSRFQPFAPSAPPGLAAPCSPTSSLLWPNQIASTRTSSIRKPSFLQRPRYDRRGKSKPSRVPAQGCTCVHGFLRQRGAPQALTRAVLRVLPSADEKTSALRTITFSVLNHPGHTRRYRRFDHTLTGVAARLAVEVMVSLSFLSDFHRLPCAS